MRRRALAAAAALLAVLAATGCRIVPGAGFPGEPLQLTQVASVGDPARRASMRLVIAGLDADERGRGAEASSSYQRALQVDPNNPYAWLALARQEVFEGDPDRGLAHLDKAQALLGTDERAAAHLAGIRGAGLVAIGERPLGEPFLREARERAPRAWSDGMLDAAELR
jgi:tetratricopeptide (TPR) repeat protein